MFGPQPFHPLIPQLTNVQLKWLPTAPAVCFLFLCAVCHQICDPRHYVGPCMVLMSARWLRLPLATTTAWPFGRVRSLASPKYHGMVSALDLLSAHPGEDDKSTVGRHVSAHERGRGDARVGQAADWTCDGPRDRPDSPPMLSERRRGGQGQMTLRAMRLQKGRKPQPSPAHARTHAHSGLEGLVGVQPSSPLSFTAISRINGR